MISRQKFTYTTQFSSKNLWKKFHRKFSSGTQKLWRVLAKNLWKNYARFSILALHKSDPNHEWKPGGISPNFSSETHKKFPQNIGRASFKASPDILRQIYSFSILIYVSKFLIVLIWSSLNLVVHTWWVEQWNN